MRFILVLITMTFFAFSFTQAYAKRFGGGKSFGVQRSITRPTAGKLNSFNNSVTQQGNRWLAPMMGLVAGGLIGSLLMNHGLGTGILTWLLIGGAIFLLYNLFRRQTKAPLQYQTNHVNDSFQNILSRLDPAKNSSAFKDTYFDNNEFLRNAKVLFLRLQTAYDQGDINDIKNFTTPQIFAEIQLQLQERGNTLNKTHVNSLNAELIDTGIEDNTRFASVMFSGSVQEYPAEDFAPFKEIWHFQSKPLSTDWLVAGIQQDT